MNFLKMFINEILNSNEKISIIVSHVTCITTNIIFLILFLITKNSAISEFFIAFNTIVFIITLITFIMVLFISLHTLIMTYKKNNSIKK